MKSSEMSAMAKPGLDPRVGSRLLGRYRVEALLARGGMGRVYRGFDSVLRREVAVKVVQLGPTARHRQAFLERFAREASVAAQLGHPHSVAVFDYGVEADGDCFMVMELLKGQSLAELLAQKRVLSPQRALVIAGQIASVLCAAHARGAMHRDLKPANVFCVDAPGLEWTAAKTDFCKVLDFGLTKRLGAAEPPLTRTGQTLGSPNYMAPEQIRGGEVDGRVDVYALGAVLFEMLVGQPPYVRPTSMATMMAHIEEPVPRLAVTPVDGCPEAVWHTLSELLLRALAKDPSQRFASMPLFAAGLAHAQSLLGSQTAPLAPPAASPLLASNPWSIVPSRGALGWERIQARPDARQPFVENASTWLHELRLMAKDVGEPVAARRAARAPQALDATLMGEGEWARPQHKPGRRDKISITRLFKNKLLWTDAKRFLAAAGVLTTMWHAPVSSSSMSVFDVVSSPTGAQVMFDGELVCSQTPCTVALEPKADERFVSLHIVHASFDEFVITRPKSRHAQHLSVNFRPRHETRQVKPQ